MSLMFQDALWFAALSNAQARGWIVAGTVSYVTEPTYGRAVQLAGATSGTGSTFYKVYDPVSGEGQSVHTRFLVSSLRAAFRLLNLRASDASQVSCAIHVTQAGALRVVGYNSVVAGTSAPGLVRENRSHRLRLQVTGWGDSATAVVHLDGAQVLSCTVDTGNNGVTANALYLYGPTATEILTTDYTQFSGVHLRGSGGLWPYSTVISDFRFEQLNPDDDDDDAWFHSTGTTTWGVTDDGTPGDGDHDGNGDTDYIYGPVGQSTCFFPDISATANEIHAVCGLIAAKKTDSGAVGVVWYFKRQGELHANGGTEFVPTTAYKIFEALQYTDPLTDNPWTPTGVNELSFGVGPEPA